MTITVATKPFDLFSQEKDQVTYRDFTGNNGPLMQFKRSLPKRVGDFPGMEKGELKITTYRSDGQVQGIYTLSSSVRADTAEADKVTDKGLIAAAADLTQYESLVKEQRLPFNG